MSTPSALGHQLLLASKVCKVACLQRHDLTNMGFYNHGYINSFIIDRIAFLSLDMTITGKLKSVGCRRSARVVLVDFPG